MKEVIEPPFDMLRGQPAWGAKIGVGTFVTIEFGPAVGPRGHGQYHLWIVHSAWRLSWDAGWVGSADSKAAMQLGVSSINGCLLTGAQCRDYGDLELRFSRGQVLRTLADLVSSAGDPWVLFTPTHIYSGDPRSGQRWVAEVNTE